MKKIIAIFAMIALAGGTVFAEITVGGAVIGTFNLLESNTGKWTDPKDATNTISADVKTSADMNRIRLEASGTNKEETFGGWFRYDGNSFGYAWWKPLDQVQVRIGSNGYDGFNSKDGVTRWGFYQTPTDTDVTFGGANAWGGSIYGFGADFSGAFYGGYGGSNSLMLEIKPVKIFGINLAVPFGNGKIDDVYKNINIQLDLNLAFGGNIALSFEGNQGKLGFSADDYKFYYAAKSAETIDPDNWKKDYEKNDLDKIESMDKTIENSKEDGHGVAASGAKLYAYFGIPINEQVSFDIGLGFTLPVSGEKNTPFEGETYNAPVGIGAGFKFASDSFGFKARIGAFLGGKLAIDKDDDIEIPVKFLLDIMPFFPIGANMTFFISAGFGIQEEQTMEKHGKKEDSLFCWHFNPFIQIGSEWGPKFLAGVKLWSDADRDDTGEKDKKPGAAFVKWAIPVALNVSF